MLYETFELFYTELRQVLAELDRLRDDGELSLMTHKSRVMEELQDFYQAITGERLT